MKEIGFRIDENVVSLPIDKVFWYGLDTLNTLNLEFELPKILFETGDELKIPLPKDKHLITKLTYNKLKKLVIEFRCESLFLSWVNTFELFTECVSLEHLEIKRNLKFITSRGHNLELVDTHHYPDGVK